jgi:hypothetical protein
MLLLSQLPFSMRSIRLRLLVGCLLLSPVLQVGAEPHCKIPADPLSGQALYDVVRTYADIAAQQPSGLRTGNQGSKETFHWFQEALDCAGLATDYQPWQFRRYALRQCHLVADGKPIECLPLWFPNDTPLENLAIGTAAPLAGKAAVVQVKGYQQDNAGVGPLIADAVNAGAQAVIAVNTAHQSLTSINATETTAQSPQPVPMVVVGGKDLAWLQSAQNVDSLEIHGRDMSHGRAANLIGWLPGPRGADKLIVVSTPINGWFINGGERGPGLALFLGLARWAAEARPAANFVFVATAGHELGEMGSQKFLDIADQIGITPESVTAWIHLGASIATWNYTEQGDGQFQQSGTYHSNLDYNDADFAPLLNQYLQPLGYAPRPEGTYTSGELAMIMDKGYHTFGFYGAFGKFHTKYDLADSTAPELLEPVAHGLAGIISDIAAAP